MTAFSRRSLALSAALAAAVLGQDALAQAKKPPATPASAAAAGKNFVTYFDGNSVAGAPTPLSLALRETRQGAAVKQTEVEGCFAYSRAAHKLDLVKGVMTAAGAALRFSGTTLVNKAPVEIVLQRSGKPDALDFAGEINSQGKVIKFAAQGASFEAEEPPAPGEETAVSASPGADVSLDTVLVTLKPGAVPALVPLLRKYKVAVKEAAFFPDCDALRADAHKIQAQIDPEKSAAFIQEAKAVAGVTNAGWTRGEFGAIDAVRMDAQTYTTNGQIDRDKILAAIVPAIAQALGMPSTKKSAPSGLGITTLSFGGPSQSLTGVGVNETTDIDFTFARENLQSNGPILIYLGKIDDDVVDSQNGFVAREASDADAAPEAYGVVRAQVQGAIAQALGGETWNAEKKVWIKPRF